MPDTLQYTGKLVITSCWCGIRLAIPDDLFSYAQRRGHAVYCPLGHTFVYADNELDRLKARAEHAEWEVKFARASRDAARDQAAAAERSARALRGHITRLRRKIADGVCPVPGCRRNFANVKAHIAGQHPEWAHDHPDVLA
jgi:hypothetical protein